MSDKDIIKGLAEEILRLQATLDHVGAFVFTKDSEGRYTYANQMVCDLFGYPLSEVVGFTDEKFFDLPRCSQLRENDRRVLEDGEQVKSEETNVISATGERRVYWTVKNPVRDSNGFIIGLCGISTDITERRSLERQVEEQKQLLDTVLNNIDAHVYMKDRDRRYLYVNPSTAALFGRNKEELIGKLDSDVMSEAEAEKFDPLDRQVLDGGKKVSGEETFTPENGVTRHYWSTKIPLITEGKVQAYVGISSDITEVVRLKEQFKQLSITDSLTGLFNRRHFDERGNEEFRRAQRYELPLSLITLDIDRFKNINDQYGHAVGDEVLVRLADELKKRLREVDIIGRLGGDEFGVLLPNTRLEEVEVLAERLRRSVEELTVNREDGSASVNFTISVGVAEVTDEVSGLEELLSFSDKALYEAKNSGRNRVVRKRSQAT